MEIPKEWWISYPPLQEHQRVFRNFDEDITNRIHPVSYAEKGGMGKRPAMRIILTENASASATRTAAWNGVSTMRTGT